MTQPGRSELEVLQQLTDIERALLKRILEIERAKLHITAHDPTDDLVRVVKEMIP